MTLLLITNCLGTFIIEEGIIKEKILFQGMEWQNKRHVQHCEAELLKNFPSAKKQENAVFPQMRSFLKTFCDINIAVAKQACKDAVKKEHFIMQAAASIQDIEKAVNPLAKRCREWYALYCPEANEKITNHEIFIETITTKTKKEILSELNCATSMGADVAEVDFSPIEQFALQIKMLQQYKKHLEEYVEKALQDIAPNLAVVAGSLLAAELLLHAGSLDRLGRMPSSTIQLLGAENALFLHLRKQGNSPRHGIIVKHPLLAAAKNEYHGKVARKIAGALTIATKLDMFHAEAHMGYALREKLERAVAQIVAKPIKMRRQKKIEFRKVSSLQDAYGGRKPEYKQNQEKLFVQQRSHYRPLYKQKYQGQSADKKNRRFVGQRQYVPNRANETHNPQRQVRASLTYKQRLPDDKERRKGDVSKQKKKYPYQQIYNGSRHKSKTKQGARY